MSTVHIPAVLRPNVGGVKSVEVEGGWVVLHGVAG